LALRWLAEARDALASILIPAPCRLCVERLNHSSRIPVCPRLASKALRAYPKGFAWYVASFPDVLEVPGEALRCSSMQAGNLRLRSRRKFPLYENEVVRRRIALLKFERIEPLASGLHNGLPKSACRMPEALAADIVVPRVPPHRDREKSAGTTKPSYFQTARKAPAAASSGRFLPGAQTARPAKLV